MAHTFQKESSTAYLGETNRNTFIYTALAAETFRIGDISHGGYNMSLMLDSAMLHFSKRHQTDPVALNCFFLNKTAPGHLIIEIEHVKISTKGYCVIRATLKQRADLTPLLSINQYDPSEWKDKVLGIITMGNLDAENGITLYPNKLSVNNESFKPYNLNFAKTLIDFQLNKSSFSKEIANNVELPVVQHIGWFRDGEPLSFKCIPFWSDIFVIPPFLLPNDAPKEPVWCPTMQLEVQFKRKPTGKTIHSQFMTHHTINGRFDITGELWNDRGEVLAVVSHQCLIVPWSRNSKDIPITGRKALNSQSKI